MAPEVRLFDPPRLFGQYLSEVLQSRHLTTGPLVEKLREALAARFGTSRDKVVLGASATACGCALIDMLQRRFRALFIDFSGVATWPLFKKHCNQALRPQLDGPMPICVKWWTDIGGLNFGGRAISPPSPADKLNLPVVVDACHSCYYDPWVSFTLMSFYPTKLMSGAEGGVVLCADPADASELQEILNCGMPSESWAEMTRFARSWDHTIHPLARKANMSDVQAAFALEGLQHFARQKMKTRDAWCRLYQEIMDQRPILAEKVLLQREPYLFQILVKDVPRARAWFKEQGMPTAWNFMPAPYVTIPCHNRDPYIVRHVADKVVGYYQFERETTK